MFLPPKYWSVVVLIITLFVYKARAELPDLWSYWRFQLDKGLTRSLLENLEAFEPISIFDEQKKTLLMAALHGAQKNWDESHKLWMRVLKEYPLMADYAAYKIFKNNVALKGETSELEVEAKSFFKLYPQSAFSDAIAFTLSQYYSAQGRCKDVLEVNETIKTFATEENQKREQLNRLLCELKLKPSPSVVQKLKAIWARQSTKEDADKLESFIVKGKTDLSTLDILSRVKWLRSKSRNTEALTLLSERIEQEQCGLECKRLKAGLLFSEKKYDEAMSANQSLYVMTKSPQDYYMRCRSQSRLGQMDAALACYKEFLNLRNLTAGQKTLGLFFSAQVLLDLERYDEAVTYFARVVETSKLRMYRDRSLWTWGWILLRQEKNEEALKVFERLQKSGPDGYEKGQGAYWVGRTLLKMGYNERAMDVWSELADKTPLAYYGVLAQNRVDELNFAAAKLGSQRAAQVEARRELNNDTDEIEAFNVVEESVARILPSPTDRMRYMQLKVLSDLGLTEDAHFIFHATPSFKKTEARILANLYRRIQDHFRALQVAYTRIGYDLSRHPTTSNEWAYWKILFPRPYRAWIEPLAAKYHYTPSVVWSLMRSESLFREDIVSEAGAIGLLQIMPYTGKKVAEKLKLNHFVTEQLKQPQINILLSSRYIHDLLYKMDGQLVYSIAAYNAGPHKVRQWMDRFKITSVDEFVECIPYIETRTYVMKNIQTMAAYQFLYGEKDFRLRVANTLINAPNPLLTPQEENWDYDLL